MNYQFKNGGYFWPTLKGLKEEVVRFYRGIIPALIIGPMSRFGDTGLALYVGINGLIWSIRISLSSFKPPWVQYWLDFGG